ncbi:MAG TPA: hypothetical protein DHN29_14180 [Cytophagales bacterium]|nr:hypothetical protein [Cytophagales bacterium]
MIFFFECNECGATYQGVVNSMRGAPEDVPPCRQCGSDNADWNGEPPDSEDFDLMRRLTVDE